MLVCVEYSAFGKPGSSHMGSLSVFEATYFLVVVCFIFSDRFGENVQLLDSATKLDHYTDLYDIYSAILEVDMKINSRAVPNVVNNFVMKFLKTINGLKKN